MQALTKLKSMFGDVVAQDREFGSKIDAARARLESLNNLPITKEEYFDFVFASIEKTSDQYVERLSIQVNNDLTNSADAFLNPRHFFPILAPNSPQAHITPSMEALFWMFPDQIRAGFKKALDRIEWPEKTTLPKAERLKEVARLTKEIAGLEQERKELRAVLAESGISLR